MSATTTIKAARLWMCELTGRVTCSGDTCTGSYLRSAIKNHPAARLHTTPLNRWTRVTTAEAREEWMRCETCGTRQTA